MTTFIFLSFLLISLTCAANTMRSITIGETTQLKTLTTKNNVMGTACQSPGGIVNQNGDCVCCPSYSGPGCTVRNKCYETSCSNGGLIYYFFFS
jgi:hypothetical protein